MAKGAEERGGKRARDGLLDGEPGEIGDDGIDEGGKRELAGPHEIDERVLHVLERAHRGPLGDAGEVLRALRHPLEAGLDTRRRSSRRPVPAPPHCRAQPPASRDRRLRPARAAPRSPRRSRPAPRACRRASDGLPSPPPGTRRRSRDRLRVPRSRRPQQRGLRPPLRRPCAGVLPRPRATCRDPPADRRARRCGSASARPGPPGGCSSWPAPRRRWRQDLPARARSPGPAPSSPRARPARCDRA